MSKRRARPRAPIPELLDTNDSSLLDLVDNLLTRGVMVTGDVMLGIARVDLIYLRLSVLLCAADKIFPREKTRRRRRA
jgi:hypothetical protein